jgi:hypothetical protein
LKLKYDETLSNVAFNVSVRPYSVDVSASDSSSGAGSGEGLDLLTPLQEE